MVTKDTKEETKNDFLVPQEDRIVAAIGYLFWIVAVIVFIITDKSKKALRFHALQSIVTGLAAFILLFVLFIFTMVLGIITTILIPVVGTILGLVFYFIDLLLLVLLIIYYIFMAFKVFTEGDIRVPKIGDFVTKYV